MSKRSSSAQGENCKKTKISNSQSDLFASTSGYILPSDTEIHLLEIRSHFPSEKFLYKIPPIIFTHQLYYYKDQNRAVIKSDIHKLQESGKIKLIWLPVESNAIIFIEDLQKIICDSYQPSSSIKHYTENILPLIRSPIIEKDSLKNIHHLSDKDISKLIHFGLLIMHKESSYTLSLPRIGQLMKTLQEGRKVMINAIKKSKYREMLISELQQRTLKPLEKLGFDYHIKDLIGAQLVTCTETTSGILLRSNDIK